MGENVSDLVGCFDFSNFVQVDRLQTVGGTLSGGPFTFCVDGQPDNVSDITLSNNSGTNSQYLVTDESGNILGLPSDPTEVDFDAAGVGVCFIWHLSYEGEIAGLAVGQNANDLMGCFSLSNPITVNRTQPAAGALSGGPFTFCVGDGQADFVTDRWKHRC